MKSETMIGGSGAAMDRRVARAGGRRRLRAVLVGATLLVAILGAVTMMPASGEVRVDATSMRAGAVVRAPFRDFVPLRARVEPVTSVLLSAPAGGQVAERLAADGATVAAGQPLLRLSNPQLELDVASRSADIAGQLGNISAQRLALQRGERDEERAVAEARNAKDRAEAELARRRTLFERNIINRAAIAPYEAEAAYQRERATALASARQAAAGTVAQQGAGIAATERELRQSLAMVRASVDALTLRAPIAGRLTDFTSRPGQTVAAGDSLGQVDGVGQWKLVADVDQFYLARVREGLSATAEIEGQALPLRLVRVLPQVADGRFVVEFEPVAPPAMRLNRGQAVDVRLVLGADRPALVAPAGGWLDGGGATAFVLDGEGRARRRAIETGRRNPQQVEIISGLSAGDRIVTSPIADHAGHDGLIFQGTIR